MREPSQCPLVHFLVCLRNPSCPQAPSGRAGAGRQPHCREGEMEGTLEAGVGMWPGDWFQGWACETLDVAI